MKNIFKLIISILIVGTMTACYSDDTDLGGRPVGDISIEGIDGEYSCTAFVGEHLQINPDIKVGYDESQMKYTWLLYNNATGTTNPDGSIVEPVVLSESKNLDYEITLAPGEYQLRLKCEAPNGYTKVTYTTVYVQTEFSDGFYILKETPDGNTDVDQYTSKEVLSENLFQKVHGKSLEGKPGIMNVIYQSYYIDEETDEIQFSNFLCVTTEDGKMDMSRTSDLKTIFDNVNITFDEDPSLQVYTGFSTTGDMNGTIMLTSKGVYATASQLSYYGSPSSGRFGYPSNDAPASPRFVVENSWYMGCIIWWSDVNKTFYTANDFDMQGGELTDMSGDTQYTASLTGWECLHSGLNYIAGNGNGVFVMKDPSGKRYIYQTSPMSGMMTGRAEMPASLKMAQAERYCINFNTAYYLYGLANNKLYGLNYTNEELQEVEMPLNGISTAETITYINNIAKNDSFNYFAVGTQSGNNYKLYLYEMEGGVPHGNPVKTITGTGKIKSLRYVDSKYSFHDYQPAYTITD